MVVSVDVDVDVVVIPPVIVDVHLNVTPPWPWPSTGYCAVISTADAAGTGTVNVVPDRASV